MSGTPTAKGEPRNAIVAQISNELLRIDGERHLGIEIDGMVHLGHAMRAANISAKSNEGNCSSRDGNTIYCGD